MIKGIIFDFDGTLYNSLYVWDDVGANYLRSKGFVPEENLYEKFRNLSLLQAAEYFKEHYKVPFSVEEIMDGINALVEESYFNEVLPKEGVPEMLKELKRRNIKMSIATATDEYLIERALKRCNLYDYFEGIFTCGAVGHSKDDPDVYRAALETINTPKEETAVFEDNLYAAMTAEKDGFKIVGVKDNHKYGDKLVKLSKVYIDDFKNLDELYKFIDE